MRNRSFWWHNKGNDTRLVGTIFRETAEGMEVVTSRRLTLPEFLDNRHMKVVRLSALPTGRLYPSGDILGTLSVRG